LKSNEDKSLAVNSISFTANSMYLASGGNDGVVKIWDLKSRKLGTSFKSHYS